MTTAAGVDLEDLLQLAIEAARRGADVHRAGRRSILRVSEKSSPFDLVTQIDHEAEREVVDAILAARPDDAVLGEESGERTGTSGVSWIVDPLDGTANYVYGYPAHAVSVGVEIGGELAVGVVHDTARDVVYCGTAERAATADGEPIRVTELPGASIAMLATGFSFDPALRTRQAEVLARILSSVRDVRRSGAASIDLCALAAGSVDACYEAALAPWDVAGGIVVARAAGATVLRGSVEGYPGTGVLGANPILLEALTPMLREAGFVVAESGS